MASPGFQKGNKLRVGISPWNKGKKTGLAPWKGKKRSKEDREKMSKAKLGKHLSRNTEFTREGMLGRNNYNWKGGISQNPYPEEFNRKLKMVIRKRDNFTCQLCGKSEEKELNERGRVLCVNHIDFNKDNCSSDNLNTLCLDCNIKINYDRGKWTNYFKGKGVFF